MNHYRYIPIRGKGMNTYAFDVTLEHQRGTWTAACPALLHRGGSVSAKTRRQAMLKLHRLVWMIVAEMADRGEMIPGHILPSDNPVLVVTAAE